MLNYLHFSRWWGDGLPNLFSEGDTKIKDLPGRKPKSNLPSQIWTVSEPLCLQSTYSSPSPTVGEEVARELLSKEGAKLVENWQGARDCSSRTASALTCWPEYVFVPCWAGFGGAQTARLRVLRTEPGIQLLLTSLYKVAEPGFKSCLPKQWFGSTRQRKALQVWGLYLHSVFSWKAQACACLNLWLSFYSKNLF